MATKSLRIFIWSSALLLVLNLIQAGTTELLDDESYYWMYSQHLAWGYYDHPPMIAWMIRAGYELFPGTLGIRLFSVLAITTCIWILYVLQMPWNPVRLIIIVFSAGIIHFGGFLAVPDIPLVFFSAVYLLLYRWFLKEETWINSILLGVCMAALVYSKYQAVLFIGLCVATNMKLLASKKFWAALILCITLLMPHFYWQWQHGLPSFQYFLSERYSSNSYHLWYTTDYIFGQLFFFGPLIGWLIFLAAFSQKPHHDHWILMLKTVVCGVLIFFFLSSFKGHVEPNWTAVVIIPSLLLLHYYLDHMPRLEKLLYLLFPFSLAVILLIRIGLV
ncbi:MAG TPA: glycosyltransferase family 39 protein, partial [Puia sp.]|nr:glycosyltransferase family 39 protein [Puia sp.]